MAFILGAVSGAALALLWAPGKGEDTRRLLGQKAREAADKASATARQVGQQVGQHLKEGGAAAAEAVQQGREFVNRQRETVSAAVGRDVFPGRDKEQA
jgi:gas vesicle protein